jgi:Apea-like HEPN
VSPHQYVKPQDGCRYVAHMSQVPPEPAQAIDDEALATFYGQEFLDYAFNGRRLEDSLNAPTFFEHSQSLLKAVLGAATPEQGALNQRLQVVFVLGQVQENGLNLAQTLHSGNGGILPEVANTDPLVAHLTRLALAIFPILSIPRPDPGNWPGESSDISVLLNVHPEYRSFLSAILEDSALSALFSKAHGALPEKTEDLYGISMNAIWSSGMGGGTQLVMLPTAALEYTRLWMRLNENDAGAVEKATTSVIDLMRKLASKRKTSVPVVVGLGNLNLDKGQEISLSGGRVVDAAPLRGFYGAIGGETTSLLILDAELSILDIFDGEEAKSDDGEPAIFRRMTHRRPAIDAASRALDREIVRARLAITLGSAEGKQYAPVVRSRWTPNPFFAGGGGWSGVPAGLTIPGDSLVDKDGADAIAEWSRRLVGLPESIWLGARRLVGAIADRIDPLDAFIDAVVCWENLLGAEAEVSFRLCAGMALLLEPENPEKRAELFSEMRELYGVRSGLVHGSREPSDAKAAEYRSRAIELALSAMRCLFDHPELLEAKSSSERNRRLVIGA